MKSILGGILDKAPVDFSSDRVIDFFSNTPRGMTADLGAMEAQSTLFAIVDGLAVATAKARWRLYVKGTRDLERHRGGVERKRHPALVVWRKPNPHYTGREFREASQQHHDLVGEFWWIVVRSARAPNGPPLELWPVRPDRMHPVPSKSNFIAGYVYTDGRGNEIPLRVDQVIYNKRPNPLDPYRGIGPVGTLLMDIEGEKAASAYNTAFFRNSAEPGGLVKVDYKMGDEEFDEFVQRWGQQHKGAGNAHRVGVLENNAEWVERRYTQRDMQFEQMRRFSRDTIRQSFKYPKPLLGDVEDVNRANAEAAEVVFAKWLVNPRLDRIRESLNDDFLPLFGSMGENVEFDYEDPIPPDLAEERLDQQSRVNLAIALVEAGYESDEVLEWLGLPVFTVKEPEPVPAAFGEEEEDDV